MKVLKLSGFDTNLFMDIFNLFNRRNVDYIGSAQYYDALGETNGDPTVVRLDIATGGYIHNPQAYGDERQFRFGLAFKF